jgi:hypothetical protein
MEPLVAGDLTIAVRAEPSEALVCDWTGKSNERQPAKVIAPYLDELLAAAAGRSVPLEVHFEGLDHFNSSTITVLIRLIQNARARGVRLVFVYDQSLKWQRLSFDALRVFDKGDQAFELRPAAGQAGAP